MSSFPANSIKSELAAEVLRREGVLHLQASGSSMLPALWPGDCLTERADGFSAAGAGDIVLYAREGRLFAHRVIRRRPHSLVTQGDCLPAPDEPVTANEFLGRVVGVRRREVVTSTGRLSPPDRILAWLLCRSDLMHALALRLHAWSRSAMRDVGGTSAG